VHEPRVASHVGSQYRRQPTLDPDWPLLHHGPQSNQRGNLYDGSEDRATGFDENAHRDVAFWPIATEIHIPWHVRYQVKSGLVVLNVSFVARDPLQTNRAARKARSTL
jgi:hypothetical protein